MLYLDYSAKAMKKGGKTPAYRLVPKLRPTKSSAAVFEELVKETGMNLPASSLESIFNSIVEATARLVEKDGWPRRIL
jgi:ribosomal protein L15